MIAVALLALAQGHAARATLAEVEINGPCNAISIELEGAGRAELELAAPLVSGERRTLSLAVPQSAEALPDALRTRPVASALEKTGHARLVELKKPLELDGISAELMARPRPVLDARAARLPWSALFVLGAAFAITLSQRRRVFIVSAIALLACAASLALTLGLGPAAPASVRMLEARFDAPPEDPWLCVQAVRGRLDAVDLAVSRIELNPRAAALHCRTRSEPPQVTLESPGATLFQLSAFHPGTRRLSREVNAFASFDEAWYRAADGPWSRLGHWPLGESMPQGDPGEPPGWLVPALPMGVSIFLGRCADKDAPVANSGAAGSSWLRGLGL